MSIIYQPGQDNLSGDERAMYLELFGGEVLTAFDEKNIMWERQMFRPISSGKSAQFPATWRVEARYHTPGALIEGQKGATSERILTLDDVLVADVKVSDVDDMLAQYEVRSERAAECAKALATKGDKQLLQVVTLAARAAATVSGANGGSSVTAATALTDGLVLSGAIFDAGQALDEKDVDDERYTALRPAQYNLLPQELTANSNKDVDGSGSYSKGTIKEVDSVQILKSNHTPRTNITDGPTSYQGDFSNTVCAVWHASAIGTVQRLGLTTELDRQTDRLSWLILAYLFVGHGILRPESAVEIKTA